MGFGAGFVQLERRYWQCLKLRVCSPGVVTRRKYLWASVQIRREKIQSCRKYRLLASCRAGAERAWLLLGELACPLPAAGELTFLCKGRWKAECEIVRDIVPNTNKCVKKSKAREGASTSGRCWEQQKVGYFFKIKFPGVALANNNFQVSSSANYHTVVCVCGFVLFIRCLLLYVSREWSIIIVPFPSDLFHLAWYSQDSSTLSQKAVCHFYG